MLMYYGNGTNREIANITVHTFIECYTKHKFSVKCMMYTNAKNLNFVGFSQ